jgi:colanic acid/amylovoran biosynthesis glycosyltransferase
VRIVYITRQLPFGRDEAFLIPEIEALLADGHELLVVPQVSKHPLVHDDISAVLARTRVLPGAGEIALGTVSQVRRDPRRTLSSLWALRRTRPRWRALLNARAVAQGVWVGRVAQSWRADHIHAHWADLTATLAMQASQTSGVPWSFTAHRFDIVRNNLLTEKLCSARFARFIARETLALAARLVPSSAMARTMVLHMGVALPPVPSEPPPTRAVPVLLCPARLVPVKGHRFLLEAASRLLARGITFELWLAGDGPEEDAISRRIEQLSLGARVRMLGTVPHAELLQYYRQRKVDGVVLSSLDLGGGVHEGISVGLIEAMAHGIPAIGTHAGGLPELLDGGAGILVPPADPASLASALELVLTSPAERDRLGRAGRKRVEAQFDVVPIARELTRRFAEQDPVVRPGK